MRGLLGSGGYLSNLLPSNQPFEFCAHLGFSHRFTFTADCDEWVSLFRLLPTQNPFDPLPPSSAARPIDLFPADAIDAPLELADHLSPRVDC